MRALEASFPAYQFLSKLSFSYSQRGPSPEMIYEDKRNGKLLTYIGAPEFGRLLPRNMAGVSPWDASVQGGDACWECLRISKGKILSFDNHLRRLFYSAKALAFEKMHTEDQVTEAIFRTLAANGMRDDAILKIILTRGEKFTASLNPSANVYGTNLIVLPEWKSFNKNVIGIKLLSASERRNPPFSRDSTVHHNNMVRLLFYSFLYFRYLIN